MQDYYFKGSLKLWLMESELKLWRKKKFPQEICLPGGNQLN